MRYNHYRDSFSVVKGRLSPSDISDRYCFDAVFKGAYMLHLLALPEKVQVTEDADGTFLGVMPGVQYLVVVEEDPVELAAAAARGRTVLRLIPGRENAALSLQLTTVTGATSDTGTAAAASALDGTGGK